MKEKNEELFCSMPIPKAILVLAVPTVISQIITIIYNMADTFFIGQLGEPRQVAAATLNMPLFMFMTALSNLFGVGGSSLISRFLSLGMSLEQVIRCVTVNPAAKLGRAGEIGTIAVGSRADIAICRLKEARISFVDSLGEIWDGDRILVPCMTIAKGRIVACQSDFGV